MMNNKYENGKIYKLENDVNDMVYIGSTMKTLTQRFCLHKISSKTATTKIYTQMREIGIDHFQITLLENFSCENKAQLEAREYEITNGYNKEKLYNMAFNGKPSAGMRASDESRKKLSTSHIGVLNHKYNRGSICIEKKCFRFVWREKGVQVSKQYSFGSRSKHTAQEAYMLCLNLRNTIYPFTHADYIKELPFALEEEFL